LNKNINERLLREKKFFNKNNKMASSRLVCCDYNPVATVACFAPLPVIRLRMMGSNRS
jgi:hypothetical protein